MPFQESTERLNAFLNEVLPDENWTKITERREEIVQVIMFLYQLLHQSDPNASDQHFTYFFRWSHVGPFSEQLMNTYRRLRGVTRADVSTDYSGLNSEQRRYTAIVQQLIVPPDEVSQLRWAQSIGMIAYLCSLHRFGNKNPRTTSRATDRAQSNLDVGSAVTNEAIARLREQGLIPNKQGVAK